MMHGRTWMLSCVVAMLVAAACGPAETEEAEVLTPSPAAAQTQSAALLPAEPICPAYFSADSQYYPPECVLCGDGYCQYPEDQYSCPYDCGSTTYCGDGICNGSEGTWNCPGDCGSSCGDGVCNGSEQTTNCSNDCGTSCGDGVCNGAETSSSCQADCALPQDPPFQETVVQEGGTWQLKTITGTAVDENTGATRTFSENIYALQPEGIAAAPLPPTVRDALSTEASSQDTVITVHKQIAEEIEVSLAQGYLTPTLASVAESDTGEPVPLSEIEKYDGSNVAMLGSCSDRVINKSKTFSISTPVNFSTNPGGGFSGTVSATGDIQANATGELQVALKRTRVLWWCIPYGVRFNYAKAYGTATVGYNSSVSGTISYANSWQWELAKPHLFSLNFAIGPIPVHIGFNLPINLGLELTASATGTVNYTGAQSANGSFNYTCTLNGCTGSASYSQTNPVSPQITTASVSGRIQPNLWVQVAVRAYLYNEWVAYAQLGVKPYLQGDLWGYYGNTCGDADANGLFETVNALTFDLDLQVYLTAQARAFGGTPKQWNDLYHTPRYHLRFWDLAGSSAMSPMLGGSSAATANLAQPYTAKMRPCWPYTDNVSYSLNWGDSTSSSLSGAPQTAVTANKAWSATGTKTLTLTSLSDSHGRGLNKATSRSVSVTGGTWTAWLNRDAPSGAGDYEDRVSFGTQVCSNPIGIQCQTTAGVDWTATGEVYSCTPSGGGVCVNANQPDGACMDYRVRFLCP